MTLTKKILGLGLMLALAACSPNSPSSLKFLNQNVSGAGFSSQIELTSGAGEKIKLNAPTPNQVTALFFGFTQCPEICPTTLGTMKLVKQGLEAKQVDSKQLRVVFVSLDPERDSQQILKEYTSAFDPSFIGAATDLASTQSLAKSYNVTFEKVGKSEFYTLNHSANLYLIDAEGHTRVSVPYGAKADLIVHDVMQLLDMAKK